MTTAKDEKKDKAASVKLTFTKDAFQKTVAIASDFIERKATMPILSHLRMDSDGKGNCRIMATDLDVAWSRIIDCTGPKHSVCIPADLLLREIKALPASVEEVVLVFEDKTVNINARCKMFTMPVDEYPSRPDVKDWAEVKIDNLVEALRSVSPAMGDNDSRYTLNSAFLDFKNNAVVATDGHRLHHNKVRVWEGAQSAAVIVPRRAVQLMVKYPMSDALKLQRKPFTGSADITKPVDFELDVCVHKVKVSYKPDMGKTKLIGADVEWTGVMSGREKLFVYQLEEGIKSAGCLKEFLQRHAEKKYMAKHKTTFVNVSKSHMTYPAAGGEMFIRLIEGSYPDWKNVIPKNNPVKVKFTTNDFMRNLDGAIPISQVNAITLKVNGSLQILSANPDLGAFKTQMPCESQGKTGTLEMKFNARYLLDAIKAFPGETVVMEVSDPLAPALVNGSAIVMPMRPDTIMGKVQE